MAGEDNKPQAPASENAGKSKSDNAGKASSKLKEAPKPEEGTVVSFSEKMWIEGTGESKHLAKGKKLEVNRTHGEHLVKKGAAKETTAPPKVQPKPKKTKTDDEDEDD